MVWQDYLIIITYSLFSLFGVGVSRSQIHNNTTAGSNNILLTDTANKIATAILHYMHVKWWSVIRGQM